MVDFTLPAAVEAFRGELQEWLREHLTAEVIAAGQAKGSEAAFDVLRGWDAKVFDAGWGAIAWPVAYGGRGATVLEQLVFTEETITAGAPTPVNVIGIQNIAPAIMEHGTEAQARELLPRMVRADDIWCQGMSEPEAGSDLASLRTRATLVTSAVDGDHFVVTGQKTWTSVAQHADWCALFVRTDPDVPKHQGISCLLVDMRTPGIEVRPLRTLAGDADFNEVFFDDVRVPATALLGPLGGGWQVATSTLSHERAGAARLYSNTAVRLRDLVADLRVAQDAGAGLLDDPSVLDALGGIGLRVDQLRVLCLRAISAALHAEDAGTQTNRQASLAKTVWGELDQDLAALGHRLLGPLDPGGRWARTRLTARALTIAGGTTQVNKNITAQRVLGLPRR